ncbi:MAG: hypothetical protein ACR2OZ_03395 [Verrucomicrobiales bacterium]
MAEESETSTSAPSRWRKIVFHPLLALLAFVIITQALDEDAYPFSSFPMYSNPTVWDDFIYLTDASGEPLGITPHTGLSASKLNKIFNSKMKDVGLRSSASRHYANPELESKAGVYVIETARRLAERRRRPLPEPVRLMRVIIERHGNSLTEASHLVVEG